MQQQDGAIVRPAGQHPSGNAAARGSMDFYRPCVEVVGGRPHGAMGGMGQERANGYASDERRHYSTQNKCYPSSHG
jgi:hypothetical protein